jgi:hypothetical protein
MQLKNVLDSKTKPSLKVHVTQFTKLAICNLSNILIPNMHSNYIFTAASCTRNGFLTYTLLPLQECALLSKKELA